MWLKNESVSGADHLLIMDTFIFFSLTLTNKVVFREYS